jgi:sodium transport system permease protein
MVAALFRNELRMILRDKRSVLAAVVLPFILMPVMLFASTWMQKKREQHLRTATFSYAVTGSQADRVRAWMADAARHDSAVQSTNGASHLRFEESREQEPLSALTNGALHLVVEGLTKAEAEAPLTNAMPGPRPGTSSHAPFVRLSFRADRDDSRAAADALDKKLRDLREQNRANLLADRGFPFALQHVATVSTNNLGTEGHVAGLNLGRMLPALLLFFMMMAGAMVATDLLAGEKERGTLESLLTSSATRLEIATAKHLVIVTVALVVTLLQSVNLLFYVGLKIVPVPAGLAAAVPPSVAVLLFVLFLPVAALVAGVLLLTSGYAKSYKEAQLYFTPVFLLGLLPGLVPFLPGLPLRSAIVLVPVANIALGAKQILSGIFDWPMLLLAWLVTAAAGAWTTRLSVQLLSAERLVTSIEKDSVSMSAAPLCSDAECWFGSSFCGQFC